jgi:hypothetical protein
MRRHASSAEIKIGTLLNDTDLHGGMNATFLATRAPTRAQAGHKEANAKGGVLATYR